MLAFPQGSRADTMSGMEPFTSIVVAELARRGWSQGELARRVGVSQPAVSRWLANEREPGFREAIAVARELGVSLDVLAGFEIQASALSESQRKLLEDAEFMGLDLARRRLLNLPDPANPGVRSDEPGKVTIEPTRRKGAG
jgi:transcriptional regulator with XRE-family HTH domain